MKTKITMMMATLALALSSCWAKSDDPLSNLTQGQIHSIQSFAVDGTQLTGYLYELQNNYNIAYYNNQNHYWMIEGQLINAKDRTNITQQLAHKYIAPLMQKKREERAHNTQQLMKSNQFQYFTKGKQSSAAKLWVMEDPKCGFCKKLDNALKPFIQANDIQVRIIPVALFSGSEKIGAEKLVTHNQIAQDQALKMIEKNTAIFKQNNFGGTPQIFYINRDNQPVLIPGFIDQQKIKTLLKEKNISNQWA